MQEKLLTVSIAAYNVESYLRETVASLLRQEDLIELLDILIVNDGSRDQTGEIAHELAARYPQSIRVIDQPNGGYGSTINASLQMARGRYYRLLDGDDWYDPESLRTFLRFLSGCASDLVITPYVEVRDQKTRVDAHPDIPARAISLGELQSASVSFAMHEITVRTEVLRRSGERIAGHCFYTDSEFTFYCLAASDTVSRCDAAVYQYRLGMDGQSVSLAGVRKHYRDKLTVARRIIHCYTEKAGSMSGQKKELLSFHLQCVLFECYRAFLLLEHPAQQIGELRAFDREMKEQHPEVYALGNRSKLVSTLRRLHFRCLPLLSALAIRRYTEQPASGGGNRAGKQ